MLLFKQALISWLAAEGGFYFNPKAFVDNLGYMGVGMLAIFLVIGVIFVITLLLNKIFRDK